MPHLKRWRDGIPEESKVLEKGASKPWKINCSSIWTEIRPKFIAKKSAIQNCLKS
jgi:hypothetical protein